MYFNISQKQFIYSLIKLFLLVPSVQACLLKESRRSDINLIKVCCVTLITMLEWHNFNLGPGEKIREFEASWRLVTLPESRRSQEKNDQNNETLQRC